jgi:hypothetical protein
MLDTMAAGQMQNAERRCTDTQRLLKTEALLQLLSYLRMGLNDVFGYVNIGIDECEPWIGSLFGIDSCLVPDDAVRFTIADTGYGTLGDLLRAGSHRGCSSARIAETVMPLERFKLQARRRFRFYSVVMAFQLPVPWKFCFCNSVCLSLQLQLQASKGPLMEVAIRDVTLPRMKNKPGVNSLSTYYLAGNKHTKKT